jgi:hypothetical protein
MRPVIHTGGLFAPSSGPKRTDCGLLLPFDANHFSILGIRKPNGHRRCKRCARARRLGYWARAARRDTNTRISQGLRLAWARRKELSIPAEPGGLS